MTDEPSAADPERRPPFRRANEAARHRATVRWRVAIAVIVVALLAIGGFLVFGGDVPLIGDGPTGPGGFSFELKSVRASATSQTPPAQLNDTVGEAGAGVKETMDEFYLRAFVDTDSWGDYSAAFELFDGETKVRAEAEVDVLTLGPTANDDFEALSAPSGTLGIAVLTDEKDAPTTAIAEVQFLANARRTDGTSVEISSVGSFFLRQVGGTWKIFAYRVDRDDQTAEEPSATGSPS